MSSSTETAQSISGKATAAAQFFVLLFIVYLSGIQAQNDEVFTLTADAFQDGKNAELTKAGWKYQAGDDAAWANPQFDDSAWEKLEATSIKPDLLTKSGWNGRAWFRLRLKVDESIADRTFALVGRQIGASEIYLDGRLLVRFGEISESGGADVEYSPNRLPIPFKFDGAGEHTLAVRYSLSAMKDMSGAWGAWLTKNNINPGFSFSIADASDVKTTIQTYTSSASMRIGFLFVGILTGLALLHFLLFAFYRAERGNLFYSIYAVAFALNLVCGNLLAYGHQGLTSSLAAGLAANFLISVVFISLLAFLHVAFGRRFNWKFWTLAALWTTSIILTSVFFNGLGSFSIIPSAVIFLTFAFGIYLLVKALKEKRRGAWILMVGVQLFAISMLLMILPQLKIIEMPRYLVELNEFVLLLAVPIAVSVFLARNFARTNWDLAAHLEQVKLLSVQKIEQERQSAELRAENERRAKELEEARQLQLSMLPKKLPNISNLEIAAYMKPATEVGGDYYDFYTGADGTLTVAVGDATGHGLKAGSVVTAMKSLFNAFAEIENIPQIFKQSSATLKKMNLRGLFMAMTILKFKNNQMILSSAGMPAVLIYRNETKTVEEVLIKAMPLGSIADFPYREQRFVLAVGDCVVIMSDGFPEMFNAENEMIGFERAAEMLPEIADESSQEIINRFVKTAEAWAGVRPADDDVTFVVLKAVQ